MSSEFTYPSFKCILEYLEANKRIHICARSKALQKIDKKIPLHIKQLIFAKKYIYVNNARIELISDINSGNAQEEVLVDGVFRNWDQVRMPGDVCIKGNEFYELSNTENLEVRNQKPFKIEFYENIIVSRVPPDIPQQIAMKKAATVLFGGRCSIYVSELTVRDDILRLPVGFNIRIRNFLNIGSFNINDILRIIDPRSFPLKTIVLYPRTPENYYHPVAQTAETLHIVVDRTIQEPWRREILTHPHKHIKTIVVEFDYEELMSVVQDWLDHPREPGSTFTMESIEGIVKILYQIKNRFNGKVVLIPDNNDEGVYPKAVIIPIDFTSELFIFSYTFEKRIKLESIPTGTIQSEIHAYLTYRDVLRSRWSRIQERFEERLESNSCVLC